MIIEPAGAKAGATTKPAAGEKTKAQADVPNVFGAPIDTPVADKSITDVQIDEQKVKALRSKWEQKVAPQGKALREAAQAHYEVINALRREQNRLIDEADRVQRGVDDMPKEEQETKTPRPGTG